MLAAARYDGVESAHVNVSCRDELQTLSSEADSMSANDKQTIVRISKITERGVEEFNRLSLASTKSTTSLRLSNPSPSSSSSVLTSNHKRDEDLSRQSSKRSTGSRKQDATAAAPKKKSAMFNFLTLKEPSALALEEYARQQKKAGKLGRPTAVGMPGISKQKLPEDVPKVNSKWDGLPDRARQKLDEQKQRERSAHLSLISTTSKSSQHSRMSSSGSNQSQQRTIGSISSRPQSLGSPPPSQQSQRSQLSQPKSKPLVEVCTLPEVVPGQTTKSPPSEARPASVPVTTSLAYPASPPTTYYELSATPYDRDADLPDLPELATYTTTDVPELATNTFTDIPELASYPMTSIESSPVTPDTIYDEQVDYSQAKPRYAEEPGTAWYSDGESEDIIIQPQSDIQPQPPSIIHWRPRHKISMESIAEDPAEDLEELKNPNWPLPATATTAPRTDTVDFAPLVTPSTASRKHSTSTTVSNPTSHGSYNEDSDGTRPSTAASNLTIQGGPDPKTNRSNSVVSIAHSEAPSVVPSVMSASWSISPKERLGLGGRIRIAAAVPWEAMEAPAEEVEIAATEVSRRKRLSSILGRK